MNESSYVATVARSDFRTLRIDAVTPATLAPGEILVAVERLGITANTVTYALLGESFHYWDFFPQAQPARGIVPAWGYARVVASEHADVPVGARFYGYWPMAAHWRLAPENVDTRSFTDGSAHRRALPAIYNRYDRQDAEAPADDLTAVYRPLFTTASMLQDALAESGYHGAGQILLTSASSKTAQLSAWCLGAVAARPYRLVGLTAAQNVAAVQRLGLYDQVVAYDALTVVDAATPGVLLDFAGDDQRAIALHRHLGDALSASLQIGKSHWDSVPERIDVGPRRELFFAPAQIAKRIQDWGIAGFARHVGTQWSDALQTASAWTSVRRLDGSPGLVEAWQAAVAGRIPAAESWVVRVDDRG